MLLSAAMFSTIDDTYELRLQGPVVGKPINLIQD